MLDRIYLARYCLILAISCSALCYSFPVRTSRVHSHQMFTAMHVECLYLNTSYSVCGRKSVLLTM
jgi:hypothetical protein